MEGVNAANQQILLLTLGEVDKRIKEALYSNDVGCPETVLYELSQATYHAAFMERISQATWSCLKASNARARRIQKALTLLTYLALNGAEGCASDILTRLDDITELHDRKLPEHMRDLEIIIKDKAINLVSLVCDKQLLERKRKEAASIRSRFVGVASNNGHVATQILYKPIYAVDAKEGLLSRAASEAWRKWNLMFNINRGKGNGGKIREIFNRIKNGQIRNQCSKSSQILRTLGTRTGSEFYPPEGRNGYTPGLYRSSMEEQDRHRDWAHRNESSSSDYEGSTSEEGSDSSIDSAYSNVDSRARHHRNDSGVSSLSTESASRSVYEESGAIPAQSIRLHRQPGRTDIKVENYSHRRTDGGLKGPWKYQLEHQNKIVENIERLSLNDAHENYQLKGKPVMLQQTNMYDGSFAHLQRNTYRANPFARVSHY